MKESGRSRSTVGRVALLGAILLIGGALTLTARAQSPKRRVVLHEDLTPPTVEHGERSVFGAKPIAGRNPAAIGAGSKILPEPESRAKPGKEEPVHGRGGFAADRETETRPDYQTGADGTLQYVEVFNPSILPFKRMSAMDAVRDDYTLYSASRSLTDLGVGGEPREGRDLFWGSIIIELTPGLDVPIPSLAPDMRILSYESEPRTQVTFSVDGADNYYVRTDETGSGGTYRLVFLADADARYFAPQVPEDVRVRDLDPKRLRPLTPGTQAAAERALAQLGLDRDMTLNDALDGLVSYFRSFEAKSPPPSSGDIYWDLFSEQAGVCRHRSFAFMITANALGIPTRYVTNEAHAWVETWLPGNGWARIDLGGAALRLEVSNADGKSMYRPRGSDPFVQPPAYRNNYTQLEGDIRGLSQEQIDEAQAPVGDGVSAVEQDGLEVVDDASAEVLDAQDGRVLGPGESLPTVPESEIADKAITSLRVTSASPHGYRGETMIVAGVLLDDNKVGIPNQGIDVFIAPVGNRGDSSRLIGHTVSSQDGTFRATLGLPVSLALGDYEVYAASPGDSTYRPSVSH